GSSGLELWRSDGTDAGTSRVSDVRFGVPGYSPEILGSLDGTLFFRADDWIHGNELWRSDGTEAGTQLVADIATASDDSVPKELTGVGGVLYFSAGDRMHGSELWRVAGPIALAPPSLLGGTVDLAYSQAVQAVGGTPDYTYQLTAGALPTGLTL